MLAGLFWKSQFFHISLWNIYFCYKSQFTFTTALMGEFFFLPKNLSNFTVMIEARTLSHAFSQQKTKFDFVCSTRYEFPSIQMYERTACAWLNRSLQIVYTDWMWMFSIIILYAVATIFDFIQIPRYTACWITALFLACRNSTCDIHNEGELCSALNALATRYERWRCEEPNERETRVQPKLVYDIEMLDERPRCTHVFESWLC